MENELYGKTGEKVFTAPVENGRKHEGGILDAAAYGNNFVYSIYKNKTDNNLMIQDGDTPLDWTSDEAKEIIKPLSMGQVQDLSSTIHTVEHLKAAVARQTREQDNDKYLTQELGETGAMVSQMAAGIVDADIIVGGAIFKGAKIANDVWKANTATKVALGAGAGATDAFLSDAMLQATQSTDKTEQRMYAAAFGGTIGSAIGKWAFDGTPNLKDGDTMIDRVAKDSQKDVTDALIKEAQKQAVVGKLKFGASVVHTPGSRLHASNDVSLREFADATVTPVVAKTNQFGEVVTTKENATHFKKIHQDQWTSTQRELDLLYNEARTTGFNGTQKDFEATIHSHYVSAKSKADKAALEGSDVIIRRKLKEARKTKRDSTVDTKAKLTKKEKQEIIDYHTKDKLDKVKIDYSNGSTFLTKGAKSLEKYYNYMGGKGKSLGVAGMENIRVNGFHPRSFDINRVTADKDGFVDSMFNALRGHARNADQTDKALKKAAINVYNNVIETHARRLKGITHDSAQTATTKRRSIEFHDEDMLDYLDSAVGEVGQSYSRSTSGRLALQESLGYSTKGEFNAKMKELGIRETRDMGVVFDTIAGTRVPKLSTGVRIAMKTARLLASPGFVLASLPEMVLPAMVQGFGNTMKYMFPAMQSSLQALRGKPITNSLANEIHALGLAGDIINARQFNRMDMDDTIHSLGGDTFWGKVENKLDVANHGVYKYGGLGYVTEVSEVVAATGGMNWLLKVSRSGLSAVEVKKLARLGLDLEDLKAIQREVDAGTIVVDKKGNLVSFNNKEYSESDWAPGLQDKVMFALDNHTKSTILRPDGTSLPVWMTGDSDIVQLMTQFIHYPTAMFEKLTLRGLSEFDANVVIGTMTSLGLAAAVTQLRDIGNPEPRYDLDTDKGTKNFLLYCISNNVATATPMMALEKAMALGGSNFGGYRPGLSSIYGPTAAYAQKTQGALGKITEGEVAEGLSKMPNPLTKVPLIGNYIKQAQEAIGE